MFVALVISLLILQDFSEGCSYSQENIVKTSVPLFFPYRSTFIAKLSKENI